MRTMRCIVATAKQTVVDTATNSRYRGLIGGISLLLFFDLPSAFFGVDSSMICKMM
jgi:hypothetical protein